MKKYTFLFYLLVAVSTIQAQSPAIEWQNTIGGTSTEDMRSIAQTSDGGYILGGSSYSKNTADKTENRIGDDDYWIVKVNSAGEIQWDETIGGTGRDNLYVIQQTPDGGYIIGGESESNASADKSENKIGKTDYWIIKLNSTGEIEWENTYGGANEDYFRSLDQTSDGGYIIGGYSFSNASMDKSENRFGHYDYWVVKLNAAGNIEWDQTIGSLEDDLLTVVVHTADGGYILGGASYSNIGFDKTEDMIGPDIEPDFWLVKINASGITEWDNTIGGNDGDNLLDIEQTPDGGYILGGSSASNESDDKSEHRLGLSDYWVVKLNAEGLIEWDNTIGGDAFDELTTITQTNFGGYIMCGRSVSDISDDKTQNVIGLPGDDNHYDYWVVQINSLGIVEWEKTLGGYESDYATDIIASSDNGYVVAGYSNSGSTGDKIGHDGDHDYWIVKLADDFTCDAPGGIYSDNISATSAKIFWDAGLDSSKYQINYRPIAGGVWQKKNSVMFFKNLTGLSPNTTYEYKIKTICGDISSPFSVLYNFTTLPLKEGVTDIPDFSIYPNPTNNNFVLSADIAATVTTIEIYSLHGTSMYIKEIQSIGGKINEVISIDGLQAGVYLVQLVWDGNMIVKQLVIN